MEPTKTIPALRPAAPEAPSISFLPHGEVMLTRLRELTNEIHARATEWEHGKDDPDR